MRTARLRACAARSGDPDVFGEPAWRDLLARARASGLLARLDRRLAEHGLLDQIPERRARGLAEAGCFVRRNQTDLGSEVNPRSRSLAQIDAPVILLKGAAYLPGRGLPPSPHAFCL